jgi:enoyl-CoA hydratase/carnithine racemase
MSVKEQWGQISVRMDGHVAVLEIDRPPHNHVSVELMRDLADAFNALDEDKDCRVLLLCSAGKNFCAGADLVSRSEQGAILDRREGTSANPLYEEAVRLFSNKKPIVAAVQGAAVGAGLGLALVADFRVCSPDARFTANFVKLGFHPGFGLTHTLPRLVGKQQAALLALTGRRVPGEEAAQIGLSDKCVPLEDLRGAALTLAREIAENAPLAVQSTRATLRGDIGAAVRAQTDKEFIEQDWLRKTADFAEGVKAVAERRPGNFVGA